MHEYNAAESVAVAVKSKACGRVVKKVFLEVSELNNVTASELAKALRELYGWRVFVKTTSARVSCSCGFIGRPKIVARKHDFVEWICRKCGKKFPGIVSGKQISLKKLFLGRRKIIVLGNEFVEKDVLALRVARKLSKKLKKYVFVFENNPLKLFNEPALFLDVVQGLDEVRFVSSKELIHAKSVSCHDLDYGFVVGLRAVLGKKSVKIIGLPSYFTEEKALRGLKNFLRQLK